MYNISDVVVYGNTGVCRVEDIGTPNFHGVDKSQKYYTLKPVFGDGVIYCPVDNNRVFIRPVISKEEAEKVIEEIPSINAQAYHNRSTQLLTEHYCEALNTHSCRDLIELVMSIYQKKQALLSQKRRLGQVDERFMKRAQSLLYGELAVALGIEKDEVEAYIASKMENEETANV
ncbi:MAG: CarD family transcriptional regulator [Oscillospiraceae bacterium]|nr:CarD family transcriptional regulator [Oscillospiraceae bacterium]MBQ4539471.1 CarD family transcriptional regulator [Oscillospiraceae bacterium]